MGHPERTIEEIVIEFARLYKNIPYNAGIIGADVNLFRLRYDTEIMMYIENVSKTQEEKEILVEIYSRYKK